MYNKYTYVPVQFYLHTKYNKHHQLKQNHISNQQTTRVFLVNKDLKVI